MYFKIKVQNEKIGELYIFIYKGSGKMKKILMNDRFFTREIVKNMFDVKVRTKFNKLRYVILKEYMKKNEVDETERYLAELNIMTYNYMNFYKKKFNEEAYERHLRNAEERNKTFKEKYKAERENIKEFKEKMNFPLNSYPMSFNNFIRNFLKDIREEIENLKEQDKKIFKIK